MAYRDFTFSDLYTKFGIQQSRKKLFASIVPEKPSDLLLAYLDTASDAALSTEKAVSEALVYPILQEIRLKNRNELKLFSGENLLGDRAKGLNGECDFILSKSPKTLDLGSPIINITEAKQGDIENLKSQAQAAAQLLGARLFNQHHGSTVDTLYGACTSGFTWVFLKLEGNEIFIDTDRYSTSNLPQLLGVLQTIINFYK
jgi:hypothetical protein